MPKSTSHAVHRSYDSTGSQPLVNRSATINAYYQNGMEPAQVGSLASADALGSSLLVRRSIVTPPFRASLHAWQGALLLRIPSHGRPRMRAVDEVWSMRTAVTRFAGFILSGLVERLIEPGYDRFRSTALQISRRGRFTVWNLCLEVGRA